MYQAKRSVANGVLYDGTVITEWPVLYSEGITAFNYTRGFDMVVCAEPAAYETIAAACDVAEEWNVSSAFSGETGAQVILMNMLRTYGAQSVYGSEIAIAGSGAVGKVMIVFLSCVIGIALGCQPIFGFNYGSKRYDRVIEAYRKALRYGTTLAVIAFLCIQLFPRQILSIFGSEDPLFYEFSIHYIRIYLLMTFVNAFQPITSNFFTSIGKAKLGFWMALVRQGLLLIPLLLLLPLALGMDGVLWAGPISDGVAAVLVLVLGAREVRRLTAQQEETP